MTKKKISIDDLAVMINRGFEEVDKRFESLKGEMKTSFEVVGKDIQTLKLGQEDIKLRLSEVAYRFELEAVKERVEVLERKVAAKSQPGSDEISYDMV